MRTRFLLSIPIVCVCGFLAGSDLAKPTVAKFLKLLLPALGSRTVACADKELAGELANLGVGVLPDSKCIWLESERDLPRASKEGRIVVCGSLTILHAGAAIAVIAEGGRPAIYINLKVLNSLGVTLPDNLLKLAKVAQ